MRVAILCLGSQGDVRPFIALGVALKADGHKVTILANFPNDKLCIDNDLNFIPLAGDLTAVVNSKTSDVRLGKIQVVKQLNLILKNAIREQFGVLSKELRNVDAVIYHPAVLAAEHVIEAFNIPSVRVHFQPDIRSRHYACCIFPPGMPLKRWSNLASHFLAAQIFWLPLRGTINEWRTKVLGLKKLGMLSPTSYAPFYKIPKLIAVSKALVPPAPDWPDNVHVTGYAQLSKAAEWTAPASLQKFLSAGPAPLYIGFGSLTECCDEKMSAAILAVIEEMGVRTILSGPFAHIKKEFLPEHIFWIDSAPHDWLFPKVSAVVHHGGSGTTHAGLYAGKPALIVPFVLDQFHWADAINRQGLGPKSIPAKKFTQGRFRQALQDLLNNSSYSARATKASYQVQAEQGVKQAVEIFYQHLRRT